MSTNVGLGRATGRVALVAIGVCIAAVSSVARAQDAAADTGQILVVTEPAAAHVFVDGRDVGAAPVSVPALVPGAHLVVAIADDGTRVEQVVEIVTGRSTLVQIPIPAAAPPSTAPSPSLGSTEAESDTATATAATSSASTSTPDDTATSAPVATTTAPRELAATDLASPSASAAPTGEEHVEDEPIAATGFPGLLGLTLGARIDVPVYVVNPVQVASDPTCGARCGSSSPTIATGRLSVELGIDPAFELVTAIDLGSGAFALGAAANLPGYIPLTRELAIALQPHLQGLVYYHPGGAVLLSAEASLRVGFAPIPNLIIGAEVGVIVLGALPFKGSPVNEGAYVGPIFGGGVEWAFY